MGYRKEMPMAFLQTGWHSGFPKALPMDCLMVIQMGFPTGFH